MEMNDFEETDLQGILFLSKFIIDFCLSNPYMSEDEICDKTTPLFVDTRPEYDFSIASLKNSIHFYGYEYVLNIIVERGYRSDVVFYGEYPFDRGMDIYSGFISLFKDQTEFIKNVFFLKKDFYEIYAKYPNICNVKNIFALERKIKILENYTVYGSLFDGSLLENQGSSNNEPYIKLYALPPINDLNPPRPTAPNPKENKVLPLDEELDSLKYKRIDEELAIMKVDKRIDVKGKIMPGNQIVGYLIPEDLFDNIQGCLLFPANSLGTNPPSLPSFDSECRSYLACRFPDNITSYLFFLIGWMVEDDHIFIHYIFRIKAKEDGGKPNCRLESSVSALKIINPYLMNTTDSFSPDQGYYLCVTQKGKFYFVSNLNYASIGTVYIMRENCVYMFFIDEAKGEFIRTPIVKKEINEKSLEQIQNSIPAEHVSYQLYDMKMNEIKFDRYLRPPFIIEFRCRQEI